ncbi:hypothetical protein PY479_11490 [Shewanella sp. A32]|uniref:hypothetical protein n=1 Tax=Shewanella sp. A32 TaxID=3031327 RepID=UPI0023B9C1A4|nr:hypothetical protein [Shewanella sp. A32]MDF0534895.1 hypothetical protein [Shewanella sp. A32]
MMISPQVDVPFEVRHHCWFCGEPCNLQFDYHALPHTSHPSLAVPACKECVELAKQTPLTSIYECRVAVKDALMKRYAKHLAIGLNWTEEELQQADFTCKTLQSFQRSAWFMYEVARDRVNFPGWLLVLNGVPLEDHTPETGFAFDGVNYSSLFVAIEHVSKAMALDKDFVAAIVAITGKQRFAYAIRLARLHIAADKATKRQVIRELTEDHALAN